MHTEYYEVSKEAEEIINKGKREGKKIIAVGTTSVRTLETVADENGFVKAGSGNTNIFIYPGYIFKCVAYNYAVDKKYKFFSFRRCNDNILIVFLIYTKYPEYAKLYLE